ncbi:MAG: DNA repair protein RadA [Bacillota bacterium]|nr:DNA repair protein RadA [Bacillota bacterium]
MAKKAKTVFMCQECGYESPKWMGQCICGAWNSMVEEKVIEIDDNDKRRRTSAGAGAKGAAGGSLGVSGMAESVRAGKPSKLSQISSGEKERIDTGIGELNRVLGGGLVPGSLTLISGEPGIGKSTIIIQSAANIAATQGTVLYVSGEESEEQIKMRADRVCRQLPDSLFILAETNMENIDVVCQQIKPAFLIIDSIQTMYSAELDSAPGSVSQVRACGNDLMRIGKMYNIPIFIVAHVTKSGDLAGPRIVEHMVDCVLSFTGDRSHEMRILRAQKNRFGTTSEIGAFEMAEEGLIEIDNLSGTLLEEMGTGSEGAVATAVYEGTRPLVLEVQALTSPTNIGFARRTSIGVENSRLNMILAVLEKKMGLKFIDQDVYVNIVGGLRPEGTYTDLAVAMAVYSSYRGKPLGSNTVVLGEIGLTGDLRAVQNGEKILKEAVKLGFERIVLPVKNADRLKKVAAEVNASRKKAGAAQVKVIGMKNISEMRSLFE